MRIIDEFEKINLMESKYNESRGQKGSRQLIGSADLSTKERATDIACETPWVRDRIQVNTTINKLLVNW